MTAPTERMPKTTAELQTELDARWSFLVSKDPPPDLMEMVRVHGVYSAIPPEVWTKFDRDMKAWKARRRILEKWP